MQFLDDSNTIIRTSEIIDYLQRRVLTESVITSVVSEIEPDPQRWGSNALHFAARCIGSGEPAILKINVPADQLWWTRHLAHEYPALLPRVYATGEFAAEGLGWILWERVHGGLHPGWHGREFDRLLAAGVAFQLASRTLADAAQTAGILHTLSIEKLTERLEQGVQRVAPGADKVLQRIESDWAWVTAICDTEICHGDLHMANALCRDMQSDAIALLIDHHPTRMSWAYEPAYAEILNAEPTRVGCRDS